MTFDNMAFAYDADFSERPIARWLRERVWMHLDAHFQPGMRVLELGCGTGEDALHLARRGVNVLATDASREMLAITQGKADQFDAPRLQTAQLDLTAPDTWPQLGLAENSFDGVYSNFGALNCTPKWDALGAWLATLLKPKAVAAFAVMSRVCLWETFWYAAHFDFKMATRRWSGQSPANLGERGGFPVYYPTPSAFQAALGEAFAPIGLQGLGVFLPPSEAFGVVESRPRWMARLQALESRYADWPLLRAWGDHFWLMCRRR